MTDYTKIRKCDVTSMYAVVHDCCFPDYFQGSSAPEVVAVPVHDNMTFPEFYRAAQDEFNGGDGWHDYAGAGGMFDDAIRALSPGDTDDPVFPNAPSLAEYESDEYETSYAYIGLYPETEDDE